MAERDIINEAVEELVDRFFDKISGNARENIYHTAKRELGGLGLPDAKWNQEANLFANGCKFKIREYLKAEKTRGLRESILDHLKSRLIKGILSDD